MNMSNKRVGTFNFFFENYSHTVATVATAFATESKLQKDWVNRSYKATVYLVSLRLLKALGYVYFF